MGGEKWIWTESAAIATHHARLRYLYLVQLQAEWEQEQKKLKYVEVEETQGQPDPYQQLVQVINAMIDQRVMEHMIEQAA